MSFTRSTGISGRSSDFADVKVGPTEPDARAEDERLIALLSYHVLDTDPDDRLDGLVLKAARIFNVSTAAISLMDRDRLWAKSRIGFPDREIPRELSIISRIESSRDPVLMVVDTRTDERFSDLPRVHGPSEVRFFAAAKLLDSAGHMLGALCVADDRPGTATPQQLDQLVDLASSVVIALELHRSETALLHSRTRDPLTGLRNLVCLQASLDETIGKAGSTVQPCSLLSIDLGRFRQLRDLAGHAGADALLKEAANRLSAMTRGRETVARIEGDEFVILVSNTDGQDATRALADEVLDVLSRPFIFEEESIALKPSIGIASYPINALTSAELIRRSGDALYWAKRRGRNQVCQYDAKLQGLLVSRNLLERDLRSALANGAFSLNWQPFVSTVTGQLLGYEALLRWSRPGHGLVPPDEFMAVAEACMLAPAIDRWVLNTACHAAAAWPSPLRLAVNLTTCNVQQSDALTIIAEALRESGLAGERLQLEIVAGAFDALSPATLAGLKQLGIRLALNGLGAAPLARLTRMPVDMVKIDRVLLDELREDARAASVITAILTIGKALGSRLCATGVETTAEYMFLVRQGCDEVQGTFVAAPGSEIADPAFNSDAMLLDADEADTEHPLGALQGIMVGLLMSVFIWAALIRWFYFLH